MFQQGISRLVTGHSTSCQQIMFALLIPSCQQFVKNNATYLNSGSEHTNRKLRKNKFTWCFCKTKLILMFSMQTYKESNLEVNENL